MKQIKINLDTKSKLDDFVKLCESKEYPVYLSDGSKEFRVSAKSTLGCIMAKMEWDEIFCEYNATEYGLELESELQTHNLTDF